MARIRYLKPEFFANEQLAGLPPLARLLFQGLWCHADRAGRLEDRPEKLKAVILPYDDCDTGDLLRSLARRGFIQRYKVGRHRYIQIINFDKHQRPHIKEGASLIPDSPQVALSEAEKHLPSTDSAPTLHPPSPPGKGKGTGNGVLSSVPSEPLAGRFYQAEKINDQIAALVDIAKAQGRKVDGGRMAAMLKRGDKTAVLKALHAALAANAAVLEDYMEGVMRNGKQAGPRYAGSRSTVATADDLERARTR